MADILQSTKKKLDAILAKIDSVAESSSSFSQPGPEAALSHIRNVFVVLQEEVADQHGSSPQLQRLFCRRAVEAIDAYLPVLGFISRASDLDGPVELYGPLWDLTTQALDRPSKLIISPEWDYSPLTVLFPQLSDLGYVLVGLPGCEANNALLTPLAGHELGHNIWASGHSKCGARCCRHYEDPNRDRRARSWLTVARVPRTGGADEVADPEPRPLPPGAAVGDGHHVARREVVTIGNGDGVHTAPFP